MPVENRETHLPLEQQDVLLKTMTSRDLQLMYGWLGAGTDKFRGNEAKTLAEGLMDHQLNADRGLNRGLVLVMGALIKVTGGWQNPEIQATLMDQLINKLGGEEKALEVIDEGVEEDEDIARITSRPKTDLGERVMEIVEQWWLSESEQAKLSAAELALDHRQQTIDELKDKVGGLKGQLEAAIGQRDEAVKRQHADGEHINLLQRLLEKKEAGGEAWNQAAREKARLAYEVLPARKTPKGELKVRDQLDRALAALDPVTVKAQDFNPPEGLAETDNKLIAEFQRLPEVFIALGLQPEADMQAAVKTVFGELLKRNKLDSLVDFCTSLKTLPTAQEVVMALPDIMHFRLEERRKNQEQIYAQNREIKEVKDFFADNELRLTRDGKHAGVDTDLAKKIIIAKELKVDTGEKTTSIEVNDEVLGKVAVGLKIENGEVALSAEMDIMALQAGEMSDKQIALITLFKQGLDEKLTPAGWLIDLRRLLTERKTELTLASGQKCALEIDDKGSLVVKTSVKNEEEIVEFRYVIYGIGMVAYHKAKNPLEFLYLETGGKAGEPVAEKAPVEAVAPAPAAEEMPPAVSPTEEPTRTDLEGPVVSSEPVAIMEEVKEGLSF